MALLPDDLATCLRVLQAIADDPAQIDEHERLKTLIAKIHAKKRKRQMARQARQINDQRLRRSVRSISAKLGSQLQV